MNLVRQLETVKLLLNSRQKVTRLGYNTLHF